MFFYRYYTKRFNHWKKNGVPHIPAYFPFGSYNFLSETHFNVLQGEDHKKMEKEKYFGWFIFGEPVLAINDVNLLKHIEVKDFDHFVDRIKSDYKETMFSGGELDKVKTS